MAVSTSHLSIEDLMGQVTRGELKLPEIQRGYGLFTDEGVEILGASLPG